MLKARDVSIYAHGDDAGDKAAKGWAKEAEEAGAENVVITTLPQGADLNDLAAGGEMGGGSNE